MYYIHKIASITHQDSFNQTDVNDSLVEIAEDTVLISPDYKKYVLPASLRRLSPILRMAVAAAKECQEAITIPVEAISVGTALGCLTDTEKFLNVINTVEGEILSPTAFIQSTHNTIAGLISLELKNHSYNMTHTQNNLSLEMALIDSMLCCDEGKDFVLFGVADEAIDFLNKLKPIVLPENSIVTSGTTFFALSKKKSKSEIGFQACRSIIKAKDIEVEIDLFLRELKIEINEIDRIYTNQNSLDFPKEMVVNYEAYSGLYFTANAFGVHLAHDWLIKEVKKYALIVNSGCNNSLGLILLKNDKAQN